MESSFTEDSQCLLLTLIWAAPGPAGEQPAAGEEQDSVWGNPAVAAVAAVEIPAVAVVGNPAAAEIPVAVAAGILAVAGSLVAVAGSLAAVEALLPVGAVPGIG